MYYGFNPYSPYQQQNYQPQQTQPQSTQDERIWVQGRGAAEAYLTAPNSFVRLWDSDGKTFYEKRADASGRPMLETFTYSRVANTSTPNPSENQLDREVIAEEIERLKKRIEALESKEGTGDDDAK